MNKSSDHSTHRVDVEAQRSHALTVRMLRHKQSEAQEDAALLADALRQEGRQQDAREVCITALQRDPSDVDLLVQGALIATELGQTLDAKTMLVQAAQLAPNWGVPFYLLAEHLLEASDQERAWMAIRRARSLTEAGAPYSEEIESIYQKLRSDMSLTIRLAKYLSGVSQEDAAMLANALVSAGREEEALKALNHGLKLDPSDADAHFVRGNIQLAIGDRKAAEASLREASRLELGWADPIEALADLFETDGDVARASQFRNVAAAVHVNPNLLVDFSAFAGVMSREATKEQPKNAEAVEQEEPETLETSETAPFAVQPIAKTGAPKTKVQEAGDGVELPEVEIDVEFDLASVHTQDADATVESEEVDTLEQNFDDASSEDVNLDTLDGELRWLGAGWSFVDAAVDEWSEMEPATSSSPHVYAPNGSAPFNVKTVAGVPAPTEIGAKDSPANTSPALDLSAREKMLHSLSDLSPKNGTSVRDAILEAAGVKKRAVEDAIESIRNRSKAEAIAADESVDEFLSTFDRQECDEEATTPGEELAPGISPAAQSESAETRLRRRTNAARAYKPPSPAQLFPKQVEEEPEELPMMLRAIRRPEHYS